jgi:hypothetical protein
LLSISKATPQRLSRITQLCSTSSGWRREKEANTKDVEDVDFGVGSKHICICGSGDDYDFDNYRGGSGDDYDFENYRDGSGYDCKDEGNEEEETSFVDYVVKFLCLVLFK